MASTIVIPSTNADNTLYSGLADVFDTYSSGVKTRRDEEEAEFKRSIKQGAALRKRNNKIRADKKKERSLSEMMSLGDVAYGELKSDFQFNPQQYDPRIDAGEIPGYTKEQQDQARFALKSKYPKYLRDEDPRAKTIADSVKERSLNAILTGETRLGVTDRRKSVTEQMFKDVRDSGMNINYDEHLEDDELKLASNNVEAVLRRVMRENPRISEDEVISIYRQLLSDPSNLFDMTEDKDWSLMSPTTWGDQGDIAPLSVEKIYNKVRSELPQDSGQGQQAAPTGQAPNQQFSPAQATARANQLMSEGITDLNEIMRIMRSEGYN